jgi:cation diffusion facilitator CzcD-associated flavoprotein CzcO
VYEAAADVGGVWYWNRYPVRAAMSKASSIRIPFAGARAGMDVDGEVRRAAEILRYIQRGGPLRSAPRHRVQHARAGRDVRRAQRALADRDDRGEEAKTFDDATGHWKASAAGRRVSARFVVMATGALSVPRLPDLPGMKNFKGNVSHGRVAA